jgi:Na+-driven multidrug efflux pump
VDLARTSLVDGEPVRHLLLKNPFSLDLGVRGIALGTVVAEAIGMCIVLAMLIRGTGGVRLRARRLKPHWHTLRRLLRVGLPSFAETFGMWIGNYAVIILIGMLGSEAILGSHIIAIRLESLSFGPGFAMGMVASILAGQYLGAKSPAMARKAILFAAAVAALQMGLMGILFITLGRAIAGLISSQPEHLHLVPPLLFWTGLVQVPFAIGIALRVGLRGAGDAKWVMWLTWITTYAVRLPLVYFASRVDIHLPAFLGGGTIHNPSPVGGTLEWVWIALCAEIVVRAVLFIARFVHGGWQTKRV